MVSGNLVNGEEKKSLSLQRINICNSFVGVFGPLSAECLKAERQRGVKYEKILNVVDGMDNIIYKE